MLGLKLIHFDKKNPAENWKRDWPHDDEIELEGASLEIGEHI